jgi:hypothetical protein
VDQELDESVYPDEEPPREFTTAEQKADYVHRICSAFDFGVLPERATIELFSGWKEIFERFQLPHSPAYHAFRSYYGWEPVERLTYFGEPGWLKLDRAEGREDPCESRV